MKKNFKFYAIVLVLLAAAFVYFGTGRDSSAALDTAVELLDVISGESSSVTAPADTAPTAEEDSPAPIDEDGWYYSKDEVALYIHTYGRLPDNFVSKSEAEKAGWSGGSVEKYIPGAAIGGSRFGNYEGILPKAPGRTWTECDINTQGKSSRGAERIVFSNDGLIYYTADHYESFELLYGEE